MRQVLAAVTGTHSPEQVIFHNQHSGRSFGHRLEFDGLRQALEMANRMRGPRSS